MRKVSIPFKRESTWKVVQHATELGATGNVSIPFKREKHMESYMVEDLNLAMIEFQFPSNGKAHGKNRYKDLQGKDNKSFNSLQTGKHMESILLDQDDSDEVKLVSIPFKRESTWKDSVCVCNRLCFSQRFNSLQTGKHMERIWVSKA